MRALQDNKAYDLRSSCRVVSRKVSEKQLTSGITII